MRRAEFRVDARRALSLLARAPVVHLATTTPAGAPVLRALDAAVLEDGVYFHGARAGEKAACLGRPAVVSAEEVVARVPSWMLDPVRACHATTLFRSVQVHGTLTEIEEPAAKSRALEALMRRWQPEGRHQPLAAGAPLYSGPIAGVLVFAVPFERVEGKFKLLQNLGPEEIGRVLRGLWERGAPGDAEAIEAIRDANPGAAAPPFLAAEGVTLHAALGPDDARAVEALLAGEYWWEGHPRALIASVHREATAWVGARAPDGTLVASGRALADRRCAWLYDVVVAPPWRGRGLGRRVTELLLDHPAVRHAGVVRLVTRDAQGLYAGLGFVDAASRPRSGPSTEMVLDRAAAARRGSD